MTTIRKLSPAFWTLSMGVIVLYMFGLVMGVFSPDQLVGWTVLVAILGILYAWHRHAMHEAMERHDPEVMEAIHHARERRGF